MKKIFLIIAISSSIIFSQNEQQGIELPDFVITGKQNIDLPVAIKKKPELISTISKDFLTPQFSPEELALFFSTDPVPVRPGIKETNQYFAGTIKMEAGRYSLPAGLISLNQSFENYLFNASAWGVNSLEHIPNSGFNKFGFSLTNEFYFSTKSDFVPGSKIKIAAEYQRSSYYLYASAVPNFLREINNGNAAFSFENKYNRWINICAFASGNILSLGENGFKETNLNFDGLLEFKINSISIGVTGKYINQNLNNNLSGSAGNSFYSASGFMNLYSMSFLKIKFGIEYASNSSDIFISPFAAMQIKFDKGLSLLVGFNPHSEYITNTKLINQNPFYTPGVTDNIFTRSKFNFNGKLIYEYEKLFSVSLNGDYSKIENHFYYNDITDKGKYDITLLPESKIFSASMNFVLYPVKWGYIDGQIKFCDARDNLDNFIPYTPAFSSSISYGYDYENAFGFKTKYTITLNTYSDITNSNKLIDYHNISLSFYYELFKGLKLTADFQNIFNRANFVWKDYQEKPFDILFGAEYRW
jgi:hypothetical protein